MPSGNDPKIYPKKERKKKQTKKIFCTCSFACQQTDLKFPKKS